MAAQAPAISKGKLTRSGPRLTGDGVFRVFIYGCGLLLVLIMVGMAIALVDKAWPSITEFKLEFLYRATWNPVKSVFGAAPLIYGTLVSAVIALVLVVPVSIGCAVFLSELAPGWLRTPVSFMVEMLAAIPSVIYGLWGLFVLVPFV